MSDSRRPALAPRGVSTHRREDGAILLTSQVPLPRYAGCLSEYVALNATRYPERVFLGERDPANPGDWRVVRWGETRDAVRRLAAGLLEVGVTAERPLMLLSGNSVAHGLLSLAAMEIGVPAVPVSEAYSLMSSDFARLTTIVDRITPGAVFVESVGPFEQALRTPSLDGLPVITRDPVEDRDGAWSYTALLGTPVSVEVEALAAKVGPDTIAKVLFTSGSTGAPKGVINTQRMLCSNQAALAAAWPFLGEGDPPVLCDWLPWNHTFGGNFNFNLVVMHGGTLWIDGGKPAPGLFDRTLRNLRERPPSLYFNVPRGFALLVDALERDDEMRDAFFEAVEVVFYAAAALPDDLWARLERLADDSTGRRPLMVSGWGSTETAPCSTIVHWPIDRAGVIGNPVPGSTVALVPSEDSWELRVSGPNVTPGYWRDPAETRNAFDAEGFYRIGDAGRLQDPLRPEEGIVFDGRVSEDFKLNSGTWVHAGKLRLDAIAALAPLISDCVVTGHDRGTVGLLLFPEMGACREVSGLPADASDDAILASEAIRLRVEAGLREHNRSNPASSRRFDRALWLTEPPSIDANEITDKGYINQRTVLTRRAAQVDRLYSDDPGAVRAPEGAA